MFWDILKSSKKFKTLSYFLKCHLTTFSTFPHMCLFHPSGEFDSLQVMTFKYRLQGSLIGEGSYLLRMLPSSSLHNSPPRNTLNEGDCQAQTHQDHKLRGMIWPTISIQWEKKKNKILVLNFWPQKSFLPTGIDFCRFPLEMELYRSENIEDFAKKK